MVELLSRYSNQEIATRLERILSGRGRDQLPVRPTRSPRRQTRLSADQVEELVRLRENGAEHRDLAAQFGMSRSAVIENLKRVGVPGRRWPGRTLSPEELNHARELYENGLNFVAVSERLDVDRRYLRAAFRQAGFPIRSGGRQPRH